MEDIISTLNAIGGLLAVNMLITALLTVYVVVTCTEVIDVIKRTIRTIILKKVLDKNN